MNNVRLLTHTRNGPMLVTEMHTHEIPAVYQRFEKEIGAKHWRARVRQCKQEIKGNSFLNDYVRRENEIAFQLDHLADLAQKDDPIPIQLIENREIYSAAGFAMQILSIIDGSSKEEAERIRRRVHGAFRNPDDMRGLRLELSVATHFIQLRKRVSWPESTGTGRFDLLVDDIGQNGLEVECKSISGDKGRKIHEREVLHFYALLKPYLGAVLAGLKEGLSVVLTMQGRLPSVFKERQALAKQLARQIFTGSSGNLPGGTNIRIKDFDAHTLGINPFQRNTRELRKIVDGITETNNRQMMILGSAAGGALALSVQSAQDDDIIKAMFDTLSDAAKRQLSCTRAGLLLASIHGLDAEQLRSIGLQDQTSLNPPTALRVAVSDFLNSRARDHLVGVGFLSRSGISSDEGGIISTGGTAYYFHKQDSPYWSDDFRGLFSWEDEAE